MLKKASFALTLITVLAMLLSSVALAQGYQRITFEKKEPVVIGYSVYDMLQPYWQAYAKGIEDAAKAAGYGFVLSDQKSSEQIQVSGSIDLINQGISALIVSPVQPPALPAIIDAAHEAKIPVIIGDVGVAGDYDAFILSDNEGGGKMAAQYMVEKLKDKPGTKEILVIELHPGSAVGEVRVKGFVDEIAKYPDFQIVASLNGNDTVEGGYQVTQDTLSAHPNLAGIYAANDPSAIGAVQALKAAGKNGVTDVLVVGFNADPPALELIKAGEMAATIRQDPYGQGQKAVEIATALMNNQDFPFSDPEERTVFFPVNVVDATNVDQYLAPTEAAAPYKRITFEKKEPVVIGYSVYDMLQPYWQAYAKGIEDAAKAAGYGFVLSDQKSSEQIQVSGSIDLINQGISALIVSPVQPPALPAIIDAAHEAKIPVIIGDVGVAGDYDAFILSDNEGGGKMAAQYMVEKLKDKPGTKEILVIELHPGSAVGEVRVKGFVDEIAKYPDFQIVASLNGNDTVEGGYQVTQDTLSAHPNLAGIYAANDPSAIGAVQALKAAGKNGVTDVLVVGFNADPPALELIKAGEMAATIRQDPYGQGQKAVEIATALMNNQDFPFSDPEERTVFFPVNVVDATNVDQYLQK